MDDNFARFEHDGWQRVADKYDFIWSPLTRQFIRSLLENADNRAAAKEHRLTVCMPREFQTR